MNISRRKKRFGRNIVVDSYQDPPVVAGDDERATRVAAAGASAARAAGADVAVVHPWSIHGRTLGICDDRQSHGTQALVGTNATTWEVMEVEFFN